jgi:plasmid stabilization system protein ParE
VSGPYRVIFAATAVKDLDHIAGSLASVATDAVASDVVKGILAEIESLNPFPRRDVVTPQPPAKWPVRSLPVPPYMVYFRVDDDSRVIRVVRVRRGSRRPLRRFP